MVLNVIIENRPKINDINMLHVTKINADVVILNNL